MLSRREVGDDLENRIQEQTSLSHSQIKVVPEPQQVKQELSNGKLNNEKPLNGKSIDEKYTNGEDNCLNGTEHNIEYVPNEPVVDLKKQNKKNYVPLNLKEYAKAREEFKFPKDFSFQDKEFLDYVIKLYGADGHSRSDKKILRKLYREKCIDYLVEEYEWPKPVAKLTAKVIGLPAEKRKLRFMDILIAPTPGTLTKMYVEPISKFMNRPVSYFTKLNIGVDVLVLGMHGTIAYGLGEVFSHFMEQQFGINPSVYGMLDTAKDGTAYYFYGNMAFRTVQTVVRTYLFVHKKQHSPSIISVFDPFKLGTTAYLYGHDLWKKSEKHYPETTDKIKEKYHEFVDILKNNRDATNKVLETYFITNKDNGRLY